MRRALLVLPVLLAAACGGSGALPAEEVATRAEDSLEEQAGTRPDITCPDELPAEVGSEMRCTLTVDGDPAEYGVTVTVTSVEGDTANFDVQVDEQPQG
jgi:hypothetical protein